MSIFGWSYPPGAANDPFAPYNQPDICMVCGRDSDACICPECPVCKEYGNRRCYKDLRTDKRLKHHGLLLNKQQRIERMKREMERLQEAIGEIQMDIDHLESGGEDSYEDDFK